MPRSRYPGCTGFVCNLAMPGAQRIPILLAVLMLAAGCASGPAKNETAEQASDIAASMVGKPYRYGGNNPGKGFDCSGLVQYSYNRAGIKNVSRTTDSQRQQTRKVSLSSITRGDLVFFNQEGKFASHVGIYLGNNRFVHAPSSGKNVRIDSFDAPYWQKHLVDARRF